MKAMHESAIPKQAVEGDGANKAYIQWLIGPADTPPNFALRKITLERGGATPLHRHDYEHETYILSGAGVLFFDGKEYELKPGFFALVDSGKMHQFKNTGDTEFVFLCAIPLPK